MIGANDRKVNNGMKILHSNLISIVENLLEKDKNNINDTKSSYSPR